MQMFKNQTHIQGDDNKESFASILVALGEIGRNTKEILGILQDQNATSTQLISLVPNAFKPFRKDGFTFSSLFISDAQAADAFKLVVKVDGIQYTKQLAAGENVVNIPNNSEISCSTTSGLGAPIVLNLYNNSRI
jgi:hypothetical protein